MRTLIDIPETDIKALDRLGRRRGMSRAKIVRLAVTEYLSRTGRDEPDQAFGLWCEKDEDAVDYQRRLRAEW